METRRIPSRGPDGRQSLLTAAEYGLCFVLIDAGRRDRSFATAARSVTCRVAGPDVIDEVLECCLSWCETTDRAGLGTDWATFDFEYAAAVLTEARARWAILDG